MGEVIFDACTKYEVSIFNRSEDIKWVRIFETLSRDLSHAHLWVIFHPARKGIRQCITTQNLEHVGFSVQKLWRGSLREGRNGGWGGEGRGARHGLAPPGTSSGSCIDCWSVPSISLQFGVDSFAWVYDEFSVKEDVVLLQHVVLQFSAELSRTRCSETRLAAAEENYLLSWKPASISS